MTDPLAQMLDTMGVDGWSGPAPDSVILACTLDITPKAKERNRVVTSATGGSHSYTPTATAEYQKAIGWLVKRHVRGQRNNHDDLGVIVVFHVRNRQRRDVDNLLKALLDGCNGVAWRDDAQVVTILSHLIRGSSQPRIDLCIYIVKRQRSSCIQCGKALTDRQVSLRQSLCGKECYDGAQRRGAYRACHGCGKPVYRQAGKATAKKVHCSNECLTATRGKCRGCGGPRPPSRNNLDAFCTFECSLTWHRQRPLLTKVAGKCRDCGRPISRTAERCRACFYVARRSPDITDGDGKRAVS